MSKEIISPEDAEPVTFEHEVAQDLQSIIDLLAGVNKRLDAVIKGLMGPRTMLLVDKDGKHKQ